MKKRLLSMLLALCMVLVALPVFALAVIAEESEEATVKISFCLPDGTEVHTENIQPGVADFELPTAEEIAAAVAVYNAKEEITGKYELTAEDILGFYEVSYLGEITDAAAYKGAIINADKTFYAFTAKSVFKPGNNWPLCSIGTSFDGYRGGWTAGYYSSTGKKFVTYTKFDAGSNIINANSTWTEGGLYLAGNQFNMVTCAENSTVMTWHAIADGTVNLDFAYLGFPYANFPDPVGGKSDIAVAIAKNGTIVWPKAAAGMTVDETWSDAGSDAESNKWFYTQLDAKLGDMTQAYKDYCTTNDDAPNGITVKAGDDIQFIFKKVTAAGITANPMVTYTEVTGGVDAEAAGIVTKFDSVYTTSLATSTNFPTYETASTGSPLTFYGNWDFIQYTGSEWGADSRAQINCLGNAASNAGDAFYIAGTFSGDVWSNIVGMRVPSGDGTWGKSGAIALLKNYKVGYRYTAEYTGLANVSLSEYYLYSSTATASLGIFVNGQMVWPEKGDYYADLSKWATINNTKQSLTKMPEDFLVTKGDMIEVLVAAEGRVRAVEVLPVAVNYTMLYNDPTITLNDAKDEENKYNLVLNVNRGGMDEVKVEVADSRTGTMSDYVEIPENAENPGVYAASGYAMLNDAAYEVSFRVTLGAGGTTMIPRYITFTVPSFYIHTGFGLNENVPTTDADVTFTGNWDFVLYKAVTEIGTSAGRLANKYFSCSGSAIYADSTAYDLGNAALTAAFNFSNHVEWGGRTYGAYVRNGSAASYRYTAEGSGLADITIDKLGHVSSPWSSDVSWAIYLNGEKIWPTADTAIEGLTFENGWLRNTTAADAGENILTDAQLAVVNAQLKNIYLREGDALEFVCYAPGTSTQWTNCGNVCYASVDYTAWEEAALPTVDTVSAVMGADFGFALGITNANPQITKLAAEAQIGDRTLTVTTDGMTVRITGIRATEMTDTITYRVYAVATNGTIEVPHLIKEGTTTYADLLAAYLTSTDVKVKDMAIATLQYGAAAQTRFLYRTDDLATRVLGEGDTLSFTAPGAKNDYAQTDAAANYRFAGAALLLQDHIRLKLFIDLQAGQTAPDEALYLEVSEDGGDFRRSDAKISQRAVDDPSNAYLKATFDLLPTANASVYRFRLVTESGTVISTELTYSVATYAYSAVEDKALTDAILAFGQAARNYNNV